MRITSLQRGSTFVEMMLILPVFVLVLLFLIFSYDLVNEQLEKQVQVSANLREGLWDRESNCYSNVRAEAHGGSVIPGYVGSFFKMQRYYPVDTELESHGGPCPGLGKDKYHTGERYRG